MSGNSAENTQNQITQQQLGVEQQYLSMAQNQLQQQQTLTAPLEQANQNIIDASKTGNYSQLISAAGVPITNITQQTKQAQESAYNNIPAGAGRDAALAQAKLGEGTNIASTLNQLYQNALTSQAQLGSGAASIGLQEAGAGLNAGGQASQSNQTVMQAQEQAKSSTMGVFGSLIGAGGALGSGAMTSSAIAGLV